MFPICLNKAKKKFTGLYFQNVNLNLYTIVFIISFLFFFYIQNVTLGLLERIVMHFVVFQTTDRIVSFYVIVNRSCAIQHTDVKLTVCNSKFMFHLLK